jgi:hypothetical protein
MKHPVEILKDLCFTYQGVLDSYVDEYKMHHDNQLPEWYWYPYFYVASVWYMLYSSKTIINSKLREIYRDKTLQQAVKPISKTKFQLTYELNKQIYMLHLPSNLLQMRQFVKAIAHEDQDSKDVSDHVRQFLGPNEDWHCLEYTPSTLGYTHLEIHKMNFETFEVDSVVVKGDEKLKPIKHL